MSESAEVVVSLARQFVNDPVQPRFDVLLPSATVTGMYYEARRHVKALLTVVQLLGLRVSAPAPVWVLRWWDEHNDEIGVYATRLQALGELASVAVHCDDVSVAADATWGDLAYEAQTLTLIAAWTAHGGRGYELAEHAIGTQRTTSRTRGQGNGTS